jgi:hypothetical protein
MTMTQWGLRLCLGLLLVLAPASANASPWAEVGDNQLRTDIEILAAAGVIDGATISWPLPWKSILMRLKGGRLAGKSAFVEAAAARVLAQAEAATAPGETASLYLDVTNKQAVVYGFDGMGRGDGQGQVSLGLNSGIFSGRLSVGGITQSFGGKPNKIMLDDTYLSARLGGVRVYAGLCGLSGSLVGPGRDFGAAAFQQCPPHAADRHRAFHHRRIILAHPEFDRALAMGIFCGETRRAAKTVQRLL